VEALALDFKQRAYGVVGFTILICVGNGTLNEQFPFHIKFSNESILGLLEER